MPTLSTGIAVTFKGNAIVDPVSLSYELYGSLPRGRDIEWTDQVGSVTIESYGFINASAYGERGNVVLTGGGMDLTFVAVLIAVGAAAELGGVTRYSATFQLLDGPL